MKMWKMQLKKKLFRFLEVDGDYSGMGNDMEGWIAFICLLCVVWGAAGEWRSVDNFQESLLSTTWGLEINSGCQVWGQVSHHWAISVVL